MKASTLLLLAMLLMTARVSMDEAMGAWVGRSIDDVTASFGAPDSKMTRTDGGATYTWVTFNSGPHGTSQCRQSFVTDSSGTITNWSYSNCPRFVPTITMQRLTPI
jgi:hypothetical protein